MPGWLVGCQVSNCLVVVYFVMQFSSVAVSRRYKQFDWLQQRLVEKYSTIAIPPLPEKQIAGNINVHHNVIRLFYT